MTLPVVRPVPGTPALNLGAFDLGRLGYEVAEYVVRGEATSYAAAADLARDGIWPVAPSGEAPFAVRIVVAKPIDPARFDGTVIVEWLNVTAGVDGPVDWCMAHREMVRAGHAYVAVSAQRVGIEGGPSRGIDRSLKTLDPDRYAALHHPGDAWSFDIFSQIGRLVRGNVGGVLGTLRAQSVVAVGESQSAWFLVTYVNAIDPLATAYDGYLLHSRFAPAAPLDGASIFGDAADTMPPAPTIRADVRVPVLTVITETDLVGGFRPGYHRARQPDAANIRLWEIAGTAHADNYAVQIGSIDDGALPIERLAAGFAPTRTLFGMELEQFINFAPQHHYVLQSAIAALVHWVGSGQAPPEAPRIALDDADPPTILVDAEGVAKGGIRTPWVDVPIAMTSGIGPQGSAASLMGSGTPFDEATLRRLYPGGRGDYLARFEIALDDAIRAGHLLAADRAEILALAAALFPLA